MEGVPFYQDLQESDTQNEAAYISGSAATAKLQDLMELFMQISVTKTNENEGKLPPASPSRNHSEENYFGRVARPQPKPIGHGAVNRVRQLYPLPPGCADFEADCSTMILPNMKGVAVPGLKMTDWTYDHALPGPMPKEQNFQHSFYDFKPRNSSAHEHMNGIPSFASGPRSAMNGQPFHFQGERLTPNAMTNFWNSLEKEPVVAPRPKMELEKEQPEENYEELMENLKRMESRLPGYNTCHKPATAPGRQQQPQPVIMPREFMPPFPKPLEFKPPVMMPLEFLPPFPKPLEFKPPVMMPPAEFMTQPCGQYPNHPNHNHGHYNRYTGPGPNYMPPPPPKRYNYNPGMMMPDQFKQFAQYPPPPTQFGQGPPQNLQPRMNIQTPGFQWSLQKAQPAPIQDVQGPRPERVQESSSALNLKIENLEPFQMIANDSTHNIVKAMIDSGILPHVPNELATHNLPRIDNSQRIATQGPIESALRKYQQERENSQWLAPPQGQIKSDPEVGPEVENSQVPLDSNALGIQTTFDTGDFPPKASKPSGLRRYWCAFCKKNGEPASVYLAHSLYDPITNDVICPYLSKYRCKICAATGTKAHTESYCTFNRKSDKKLPELNFSDSLAKYKLNKFKIKSKKSKNRRPRRAK